MVTKGYVGSVTVTVLLASSLLTTSSAQSRSTATPAAAKSKVVAKEKSVVIPPAPGTPIATNPTESALNALITTEWEFEMRENPTEASSLGDKRYNNKWPDISLEAITRRNVHNQEVVKKLETMDATKLMGQSHINYEMFLRRYRERIEAFHFHEYAIPLNQRDGIQTQDEMVHNLQFNTVQDYDDWIARLQSFPTYMDQTISLMREGLRVGAKHMRVIMERVPGQIDKQFVPLEQSGFYRPFLSMPKTFSDADRARLTNAAKDAIATDVIPAYKKFKIFFVNDYLPNCYEKAGVWQWPDGDKFYAFTVRQYTTTEMTPEQIHKKGLEEVTRIHAEMEKVKTEVGFQGTMQEFFTSLRTDSKFYYKTPEELLTGYRALVKTVDPKLIKLFKNLPRLPYGVEPIPAASAPDTTAAYYGPGSADAGRAGTYFVNLYRPETRPKWEMTALSLHESVPGHHLQFATAIEVGELPKFRRFGYLSAYGEGWGLYAESLGYEMGLYEDPYTRFGQLTYDMWRAVRLVVDTGIHAKHWSREQAIKYFMDNAAKTELDVTNEVDRYIVWPGQALSYKIGQLKILELREKAKKEFAERFDIRDFHDIVLRSGAVPLDVLERNVDQWIDLNCKKACELPSGWKK